MRKHLTRAVKARAAILICAALAYAQHANATPITQVTAPASSQSYNSWTWQELGGVTLASGTTSVLGLKSSVTLVDQGWGGQDPANNQVILGLFDNGAEIWGQHVAGATHQMTTQTYDISSSPSTLLGLDAALAGIDWSKAQSVTMQMEAVPVGYPGWQLNTQNAFFSITSDVPEPATMALFMMGLATVAFISRRTIR